jgi:hypothetical protein
MLTDDVSDLINSPIFKEVNTVQIPIKPITPPLKEDVDYTISSKKHWECKSNELYSKYMYGVGLAKFGHNGTDITLLYKRLADALIESIKNECKLKGKSSEDFSCHFAILSSIMLMIGNNMKQKDSNNETSINILACLHGFIEQMNKEIGA